MEWRAGGAEEWLVVWGVEWKGGWGTLCGGLWGVGKDVGWLAMMRTRRGLAGATWRRAPSRWKRSSRTRRRGSRRATRSRQVLTHPAHLVTTTRIPFLPHLPPFPERSASPRRIRQPVLCPDTTGISALPPATTSTHLFLIGDFTLNRPSIQNRSPPILACFLVVCCSSLPPPKYLLLRVHLPSLLSPLLPIPCPLSVAPLRLPSSPLRAAHG